MKALKQINHPGYSKKTLFLVGVLIPLWLGIPATIVLNPSMVWAQSSVPTIVRSGYTQLSQGLVNQAIASFKKALAQFPSSLEAKQGLAIAYRRAGRDAEAFLAYQDVLAQDPDNVLALRSVGVLGGFKPEWQNQGIAALTRLITSNPNDLNARSQRALLYGYQGKYAESLGDYEAVLNAGKATPDVILGAAQIYTYGGNPRRGLELFEQYRTTTQKPIGSNAAIAYARALRETGSSAQAVEILEAQAAKPSASTQVRSELAQAYLANRQPTQALAALDPLRNREDGKLPLARALNEIGRQQGRPDLQAEAANYYQQVLQQTPNPSPALVREVADVLSGSPSGRATALTLYRQLVQQNPTDRVLLIQQLALERQLGSLSRADVVQRLRAVLQPLPSDPTQQFAIAQALSRVEPEQEFLPVYQTLLQSGVNVPFLYFRYAQLLIERGDFPNARAALATYRASASGAQDTASELLVADIDRREGNLEIAASRYIGLLNSATQDSDVIQSSLRGLAGIRLAQNRTIEALQVYDQLLARNPNDGPGRLARTAIAYQSNLISEYEVDIAIGQFLQSNPPPPPAELYTLVAALPPRAARESLYTFLAATDPNNVDIQVRLIQLIALRDPAQAQVQANRLLAQVRQAATTEPGLIRALFLRGQLAQALGNLDQASDAFGAILALKPDSIDALSSLGGVRFTQRNFDSAAQLYSLVQAIQPENIAVQRTLADLNAASGKPLEAIDQLESLKVRQTVQGGIADPSVTRRLQEIQEGMLQQRGFQPPWERY